MKLKVNDNVIVITGKDKGKTGKIIDIDRKNNRIKVEKLNLRTKHIKKRANQPGEKIKLEGYMNASNVMIVDPKTNKPTRIHFQKLSTGKKERISSKSKSSLDNLVAKATKSKSKK